MLEPKKRSQTPLVMHASVLRYSSDFKSFLPLPVFFQAKRCGLTCPYSPLFSLFPHGKMEGGRVGMGE